MKDSIVGVLEAQEQSRIAETAQWVRDGHPSKTAGQKIMFLSTPNGPVSPFYKQWIKKGKE